LVGKAPLYILACGLRPGQDLARSRRRFLAKIGCPK
jgi:hypothetical protein